MGPRSDNIQDIYRNGWDMNPVAIFRHAKAEGAGFLSEFLDEADIPWKLFKVDEADSVPESASSFSGLVFMGGPMSVNDALPWIPPALELIRDAISRDIPLLGHCLGGQLMARALGAAVGKNRVREIGWGRVEVLDPDNAWFGGLDAFDAFHWHGETFDLPEGTKPLLSSAWCRNQAFCIGPHLALQCHVEMTADMVRAWCVTGAAEIAEHIGSSVQSVDAIERDLDSRISQLNRVARRIYGAWVGKLKG